MVYGAEAVLPAEIEVPSARMELEQIGNREAEFEKLEDKRDTTAERMKEY